MYKIFKKIISQNQDGISLTSSDRPLFHVIGESALKQILEVPNTEKQKLAVKLYALLDKEFHYRGNTAPLKAWGYANGPLREALATVSDGSRGRMILTKMFTVLNILLPEKLSKEFQDRTTAVIRKKEILATLVDYPLERVTQHNCYSIIIYAAALADIISGRGTLELLEEISSTPYERMGGGLTFSRGRSSPSFITHCIPDITMENLDDIDCLLPLPPGRLVIYSLEDAGTAEDIQITDNFYAHVACVGMNNTVLHFWDIEKNKITESTYGIKEMSLKELTRIVLAKGSKGRPITLRLVDPPWQEYA